jgi:hypothetical protein
MEHNIKDSFIQVEPTWSTTLKTVSYRLNLQYMEHNIKYSFIQVEPTWSTTSTFGDASGYQGYIVAG